MEPAGFFGILFAVAAVAAVWAIFVRKDDNDVVVGSGEDGFENRRNSNEDGDLTFFTETETTWQQNAKRQARKLLAPVLRVLGDKSAGGGDAQLCYEFPELTERDRFYAQKEAAPEDKPALGGALIRRAMQTILAIRKLQADKPTIARANQMGYMSSEMWQGVTQAEEYVVAEINEIKAEAEAIKAGWGEGVFPQSGMLLQRQEQVQAEARAQAERRRAEEAQKKMDELSAREAERRASTEAKKKLKIAAQMEAQLLKEEELSKQKKKTK